MKKLRFVVLIAMTMLIACQNTSSAKVEVDQQKSNTASVPDSNQVIIADTNSSEHHLTKEVLDSYLEMKNALASDKTKEAAEAGPKLYAALGNMVTSSVPAERKTEINDIVIDAKEHAEHIGNNADNIKHQREHFQDLSTDIYDLLKLLGTSQTVYKDSCPMVKAIWISEKKEIVNPYYGKEMPTCGKIQETIEH